MSERMYDLDTNAGGKDPMTTIRSTTYGEDGTVETTTTHHPGQSLVLDPDDTDRPFRLEPKARHEVVSLRVDVIIDPEYRDEVFRLGAAAAEAIGGPIDDDEEFGFEDAVKWAFIDPDCPPKLIMVTHGWQVDTIRKD